MLAFITALVGRLWKVAFERRSRLFSETHRRVRSKAIRFEELEIRVTPAIGAFDIPGPINAGEGYDGVVRFNKATGALLSSARHILTAAHSGNPGSLASASFVVPGIQESVSIQTPGAGFIRHPNYPPADDEPDNFDIGIQPLAELAPLNADRWELYTEDDEYGRVGDLVGYGGTGTGTIGHSTDVNPNEFWLTSTGEDTHYELIRLTITGNPTGGYFTIHSGNDSEDVAYDTDANNLANRFNALGDLYWTLVRQVGDTDFDGVVDNLGNPRQGSFEVLFRGTLADNHSMDDISVTDHLVGGGIVLEKLLDGGSDRFKTGGRNQVGRISEDGYRLFTDFDDGTANADALEDGLGQGNNEAYGTWGDSGCPLIIDGKIAGVLEGLSTAGYDDIGGSGDFGQVDSWARVSAHLEFLNGILDDPFDLVLNMENQPWGDDGFDDEIHFGRAGNSLQIFINGILRYTEDIDLVQSITFRGSSDDETVSLGTLGDLGDFTIEIYGNLGNDTIEARRVGTNATVVLSGGSGDDTFLVGDGDIDTNIRSEVFIFGESGDDELIIDDTADLNQPAPVDDVYHVDAISFHKANAPAATITYTNALERIRLDANPNDNVVQVTATAFGRTLQVNGGEGDDTINVGDGQIALNLDGIIEIDGGLGENELYIDDTAGGGIGDHAFNTSSYSKSTATGSISFESIHDVLLETGIGADEIEVFGTDYDLTLRTFGGNDTIDIYGTDNSSELIIDTGVGRDTINLGTGDLDTIGGGVSVSGGVGVDTIVLNDQDDIGDDDFEIHANQLLKLNFFLFYAGIESLIMNANDDDNVININSSLAATQITVNAGSGADTIHLSPIARNLGQVQGSVTVNGRFGFDAVVAHDEAFAQGALNPYTLNGTTLSRPGFGGLTFATVERVEVQMGTGADTIHVVEFNRDTLFALYGNGGADFFDVTVDPFNSPGGGNLFIDGGASRVTTPDRLRVTYASKPGNVLKPQVRHNKGHKGGPGSIQIDYATPAFHIDYQDVENVELDKSRS